MKLNPQKSKSRQTKYAIKTGFWVFPGCLQSSSDRESKQIKKK